MTVAKKPIATTHVICADGSRHVGLRVFCATRGESVLIDDCRVCESCEEISGDSSGESSWVTCGDVEDDGSIGAVLHGSVVCVSKDISLQDLTAILIERALPLAFVVDDEDVLVGVVTEADLLRANRTGSGLKAADVMSNASALRESETVRAALVAMASKHARQTAVVTRDGVLVGSVSDLDALVRLNAMKKKKTT